MKKALAILLTLILALGAFAFAEEVPQVDVIVVDGDVQTEPVIIPNETEKKAAWNGIEVVDGGDLTFTGSIENSGNPEYAIIAADGTDENHSTVNMTGNVTMTDAEDGSMTVLASSYADIAIKGNIAAEGSVTGAAAFDNSAIAVNGNVTVTAVEGDDYPFGIVAIANSTVAVNGSVTVKSDSEEYEDIGIVAICTDNRSSALVNGDVTVDSDNGAAIYIDLPVSGPMSMEQEKALIVIDGTLKVDGEDSIVLTTGSYLPMEELSEFANIYVTAVELSEGASWTGMDDEQISEESEETYKDIVLEAINYIIHADKGVTVQRVIDGGKGDVDYNAELGIYSAKYGDQLIVTLDKGYKWNGKNAQLKDNGDGTYTLTVTENGNLVFKATIKKTEKKTTLAQKIVNGVYGDVITDTEDLPVDFTAARKNGEMVLTYTDDTACHLHVTAKLAKALVNNGAETLTVKMNGNTFSYDTAALALVLADETIDEVKSKIDDAEATAQTFTVVGLEETDITETLPAEIAAIEAAA